MDDVLLRYGSIEIGVTYARMLEIDGPHNHKKLILFNDPTTLSLINSYDLRDES